MVRFSKRVTVFPFSTTEIPFNKESGYQIVSFIPSGMMKKIIANKMNKYELRIYQN